MFDPRVLPKEGDTRRTRFVDREGNLREVSMVLGVEVKTLETVVVETADGMVQEAKDVVREKPCEGCAEKGFLRTAARGLKGIAGLAKAQLGVDAVDGKMEKRRRAVCNGCKQNDWGMCQECGCYLHAKVKLTKEECPLGLWPKVEG
jgi:hypothetical protein